MVTVLRPYQLDAAAEIRRAYAEGSRGVILQLPTGAGKTAIFCDLLKGAHTKGRCAVMAVRGKSLVHQASERLRREQVPHGIFQGENSKNTHEKILVCSVDTLFARKIAPAAELLVIDECHYACSDGYTWLLEQYRDAFRLGVSATPHHKRGMRHIGDRLVRTAGINDLIRDGYLVGGRYFVPYVPNLRGIKKTQGDFNAKELGVRSKDDKELTASAAKVWSLHLRGKSTLVYAVSVEHAKVLQASLEQVGARCCLVTAKTSDDDRSAHVAALEQGKIDCLVNVGVMTTGVDIPSLRAILCCRPTKSYNLWIQILGRGTRPFPGKKEFLCYDLSGNLLEHGPIESELIADLDGIAPSTRISIKTCKACYATFETGPECCPACGASLAQVKPRTTGKRIHGLTDNDEVQEVKLEPWELELPGLIERAKLHGHRKGAIYHLLKSRYGDEVANKAWNRIRAVRKWRIKDKGQETTPVS